MSTKKALALAGLLLIMGAGLTLAQEQKQAEVGANNRVQANFKERALTRLQFQDQNGDGINDFQRDHDNDGIPNCQDPDWTRPGDGTGSKNRFGQGGSQSQFGNRKGFSGGQDWSNSSFRNGQRGRGRGVCDGTGPNRIGRRRGRS
ncbi:MAG: hypothetical protein A2Y69_05020 [Candidatus Aminicenantes bacterium RBG_13_59_9]|nr:MAG: hypothetical protein A2Y69_05020 [Candidatus Aminicenantes bacterium RBG_13_59_9]